MTFIDPDMDDPPEVPFWMQFIPISAAGWVAFGSCFFWCLIIVGIIYWIVR